MIKQISFLGAFLLFICSAPSLWAATNVSNIQMSVFPNSYSAAPGQKVTFSINMNNPSTSGVIGIQFNFTYNPNLLNIQSATVGTATSAWNIVSNTTQPGTASVALYYQNQLPTGSGQSVAVLNFIVKATSGQIQTSALTLSQAYVNGVLLSASQLTAGSFSVQQDGLPPILNPIGNQTIAAGKTLTFNVTGSNQGTGLPLAYSATNLPAGATFDASTQVFSWTPTANEVGQTFAITFTVSDANGMASETVAVAVLPSSGITNSTLKIVGRV